MHDAGYDPLLVIASILIAIMAAFTGLRVASGLSMLDPADRRKPIAKAAIAIGGGIWSMHFVAMLAMKHNVPITYEALPTLGSVLVAILMTGIGFIVLHFGERNQIRILTAGIVSGLGIVSMHYLGMSAITGNVVVSYDPVGVAISIIIAIIASSLAFQLAYRRRTLPTLIFGAIAFGLAVSAMHYSAMAFTSIEAQANGVGTVDPILSSGTLAMIVAVAAFVICGLFLLIAIPIETTAPVGLQATEPATVTSATGHGSELRAPAAVLSRVGDTMDMGNRGDPGERLSDQRLSGRRSSGRIPYERDKTIRFFSADQIAAVRAEGHYSRVINGTDEYFCPWPISKVEKAIGSADFIRTHRSYLVNLSYVCGFRKEGEKAFCFLKPDEEFSVPVSRSRMADVQNALGLT